MCPVILEGQVCVCVCVKDANDTSSDWFYADTDGLVNVNSPRNLHGHPNLIDGAGITTRRDVVLRSSPPHT